ncbi:hypothetical protein RvY_02912 [Ramazzottius varieornatus]|uniref:Uncharacterized protein n=1 Tax=Ramazzottius varieornatus TaxID=947166 RepID=A0A1D1ULA7_RAMVA|nr:hypothetical protein RvY_02912 [Ramazzottius varieornatus]
MLTSLSVYVSFRAKNKRLFRTYHSYNQNVIRVPHEAPFFKYDLPSEQLGLFFERKLIPNKRSEFLHIGLRSRAFLTPNQFQYYVFLTELDEVVLGRAAFFRKLSHYGRMTSRVEKDQWFRRKFKYQNKKLALKKQLRTWKTDTARLCPSNPYGEVDTLETSSRSSKLDIVSDAQVLICKNAGWPCIDNLLV